MSATIAPPAPRGLTPDLKNYLVVTGAYWADTLTDGALRMLVLLYFNQLGYSPLEIAFLFLFYEIFGVVTNAVGGYLGARVGLKWTLFGGLGLQCTALAMLGFAPAWLLTVPYVMAAQALSGIAKDLTKMSSKSAVKLITPEDAPSALFKWVALLTGSKNAVKGLGFFVGGVLLTLFGFHTAILMLAVLVSTALLTSLALVTGNLGKSKAKAKFQALFSQNPAINLLSAARLFLFASRDVWLVVALPVFLATVLGWNFWMVGGFIALWTIGYGAVQAATPAILRARIRPSADGLTASGEPDGRQAMLLAFGLAAFPAAIAIALMAGVDPTVVVVAGLLAFGVIFALNSAVHSYLILAYADSDKVAMNVGFYYMSNAGGRLFGTVLSGLTYQLLGLIGALWLSVGLVLMAGVISVLLPTNSAPRTRPVHLGEIGD